MTFHYIAGRPPLWSSDLDTVMTWLADGQRGLFNNFRAQRINGHVYRSGPRKGQWVPDYGPGHGPGRGAIVRPGPAKAGLGTGAEPSTFEECVA